MQKGADAFRSIGEVAELIGVAPHVLRYWETQFSQLKPMKRADGRRYYRPADVALASGICALLRDDGLTIRGARKQIALDRGEAVRHRGEGRLASATADPATPEPNAAVQKPVAPPPAPPPDPTGAPARAAAQARNPAPQDMLPFDLPPQASRPRPRTPAAPPPSPGTDRPVSATPRPAEPCWLTRLGGVSRLLRGLQPVDRQSPALAAILIRAHDAMTRLG